MKGTYKNATLSDMENAIKCKKTKRRFDKDRAPKIRFMIPASHGFKPYTARDAFGFQTCSDRPNGRSLRRVMLHTRYGRMDTREPVVTAPGARRRRRRHP
jgi:hypothetical protein